MKRIGCDIDDETLVSAASFDDRCPGMADLAHKSVRLGLAKLVMDHIPQGRWVTVRFRIRSELDDRDSHVHKIEGRLEFSGIVEDCYINMGGLGAVFPGPPTRSWWRRLLRL